MQNATEGVSTQRGFDLPTLRRNSDGTVSLNILEAKNYGGEASRFSAITRNMDKNLDTLASQVENDAFGLSDSMKQSLLQDIKDRNFSVEVYGNRTTTMNNMTDLSNQIRASTRYGSNIQVLPFRRVPW